MRRFHAVLFTKGTMGDLVPFIALGRALLRRGHRVTLVTHGHYVRVAEMSGFEFVAIDGGAEFVEFVAQGALLNTPRGIPAFFRAHYLQKSEREYTLLQGLMRD